MRKMCNGLRREEHARRGEYLYASSRGKHAAKLRPIHPVSTWTVQKFAAAATSSVPTERSVCTTSAPRNTITLA
jgi:hypothetical protein